MRDNNGLSLCIVEQFKNFDAPDIVVFCSLLEHQVPILKEAFSQAFDLTALNADIKT
jgi:hypothetical protein